MALTLVTAKELREKLQPLAKQVRELADLANNPEHTWSAEDEAKWVSVNKDYDETKARAERMSRADDIDTQLKGRAEPDQPLPGREDYNGKGQSRRGRREERKQLPTEDDAALGLQAWLRSAYDKPLLRRHLEACRKLKLNPHGRRWGRALPTDYNRVRGTIGAHNPQIRKGFSVEVRAQSINIQTAGGYTIPEGFVTNLEIALLAYANIRQWADVMRTASGNDLPWPTVNDTTNKGRLISENTQVTETDVVFGQVVFHAYKTTTDIVLVPAELLEDSAFNLAATLGTLFGIRLARLHADLFTFGTGAGQPTGYVTAATLGVTSASPTAIAADEIYNLKHSVDPAYRQGSMFTFHDQILLYIKKLKDGLGRYLWQSSLAADAPDTIDGDPIGINQSMANAVSATNITMTYGLMSKYKIRDVAQMRMRRLVERYADFDQEGFVGFMRADGNLLDAGTHPIKYLQQHA
jgi:HK97 family phage major capsid protein